MIVGLQRNVDVQVREDVLRPRGPVFVQCPVEPCNRISGSVACADDVLADWAGQGWEIPS